MNQPPRSQAANGLSLRVVSGGIDYPKEPTVEILHRDAGAPVYAVQSRLSADNWLDLYEAACARHICTDHVRDVLGSRIRDEFARQAEADACENMLQSLYAKAQSA
jgi:uncharacterized protein (DUF1810 family)|tara:strand:+ start:583 stop:900 length:318 start_codon:yes stop_codon:yes gene_type:complete